MSPRDLKITVDKLAGPVGWAKWKWQIEMLFRALGLEAVVLGGSAPPGVSDPASDNEVKAIRESHKDDAKAPSMIGSALSRTIPEPVTCSTAQEVWRKSCARYASSSSLTALVTDRLGERNRD